MKNIKEMTDSEIYEEIGRLEVSFKPCPKWKNLAEYNKIYNPEVYKQIEKNRRRNHGPY